MFVKSTRFKQVCQLLLSLIVGSSFFLLFYDIFVSGTQTQGYKIVVKHVSHWYIKYVN